MPRSPSLSIRDLSVQGTGRIPGDGERCIAVRFGRIVLVERVKLRDAFASLCLLDRCIDSNVNHVDADQSSLIPHLGNVSLGQQYGVEISDSQNIAVTNSTLRAIRHAVTTGSDNGSFSVVNRQIRVSNCHLTTLSREQGIAALDTHGNTEYYLFSHNQIFGRINFAGQYGNISSNEIFSKSLCIQGFEMKSIEHTITDNLLHGVSDSQSSTGLHIWNDRGRALQLYQPKFGSLDDCRQSDCRGFLRRYSHHGI